MTPIQRNWESILHSHCPQIDSKPKSTRRLIEELHNVGLPLYLNYTARDDSLTEEDQIQLVLPGQLLIHRLSYSLVEKNASIAIVGDQLKIISRDVASDPEFFTTLVYDVSQIGISLSQLSNTIRDSVEPDDWDDTNGDGTILVDSINGRKLMTLSAPYPTHLKVRQLLNGFHKLSGSHHGLAANLPTWRSKNSTVIQLPNDSTGGDFTRNRRRRSIGGGGLGGGGGVF